MYEHVGACLNLTNMVRLFDYIKDDLHLFLIHNDLTESNGDSCCVALLYVYLYLHVRSKTIYVAFMM